MARSNPPPRTLATYAVGIVRGAPEGGANERSTLSALCDEMGNDLGGLFIPHVAPSYRSLAQAVATGHVAFAWMPPLLTLELEATKSAVPLALPLRRGSTASFYSAIITTHDGPKSVAALAGKRIAWVERSSVAGHIAPRIHLALSGFDLTKLGAEVFVGGHQAVVDAVLTGQADAGATFCTLDPVTKRLVHAAWTNVDGSSLKPIDILTTVGPIPTDAIVASTKVDAAVRARFSQWVLSGESKRTKELFSALLRADAFVRSTPSHYDALRQLLHDARERGIYEG